MGLTFLAPAGLWEHNARQQLFLAFSPFSSGLHLQAKHSSPNIYHFAQRLKHTDTPNSLLFYITEALTHHKVLYICKQTCPVWHHSATAGYGSRKARVDHCRLHQRRTSLGPQNHHHFPSTEAKQHLGFHPEHSSKLSLCSHLSCKHLQFSI